MLSFLFIFNFPIAEEILFSEKYLKEIFIVYTKYRYITFNRKYSRMVSKLFNGFGNGIIIFWDLDYVHYKNRWIYKVTI